MTVLSLTQVVGLCLNMSGNADRVADAVSVIFAESGGDTDARCYNVHNAAGHVVCAKSPPPGGAISVDRGLCQFNDHSHPEVSDATAANPQLAVGAMFHLSHGFIDFHEWSGWTSGNYRRYRTAALGEARAQLAGEKTHPLTDATAAVGGGLVGAGGAVAGAAGGIASAVTSVPEFLSKLSSQGTWVRVVQVVVGIAAVGGGAVLLGKDLSPLGQIATTAAHATAGSLKLAPAAAAAAV